jgi:ribonuclease Z
MASSQVVELRDKQFMVDCGEGTQVQIRRSRINFNKIQAVFISHIHGDHCFGLIGMISTFGLQGRKSPLQVYAPAALGPMLQSQIELFCQHLSFEVVFHAIDTEKTDVIYEDRSLTVSTIPLQHRLPTCGFLFREKPTLPHIRRDMIDYLEIPVSQINNIKNGAGWTTPEGRTYSHEELTTPAEPTRAYAYCSDTRYVPTLHELIAGVDLLYHESTYCRDSQHRAEAYWHSTAADAATVAREAGVKKLLLGHYSSRYPDENAFLDEAREIFPESYLTNENDIFYV